MERGASVYRASSPDAMNHRGSSASISTRLEEALHVSEAEDNDRNDDYPHEGESEAAQPGDIEHHLGFSYQGDKFYQRGVYTEALLYLSRLPRQSKHDRAASRRANTPSSTRRVSKINKLMPVNDLQREFVSSEGRDDDARDARLARKRQCAHAVNAMAANPNLHPTLFADNVVPTLLSLLRTKDVVTLKSCVSALCHLSGSQRGREVMLQHGCLALLQNALAIIGTGIEPYNILATFANLSIEDSFESIFVKEKALESMMAHRKASDATERLTSYTLFNLSCPSYTYPRINDVIRALVDHGRDCRDRLLLSQAMYNLTATKSNRVKITAITDAFEILNGLVATAADTAIRSNALHSLWCLAETEGCRRALVLNGSVRALITSMRATTDVQDLRCIFSTLDNLATEPIGCKEMAKVGALGSLAQLSNLLVDPALKTSVYKTISLILAGEANAKHVDVAFFEQLVSYTHALDADVKSISRYVLHSLGCLLAWAFRSSASFLVKNATYMPKLMYHALFKQFDANSADEYLQAVLLYNITLRFPPADVAMVAIPRILYFGLETRRSDIRELACGMLFNLFHEPTLHRRLMEHPGVLDVLVKLLVPPAGAAELDSPTKCLDIVCAILDQQQLDLDAVTTLVFAVFTPLVKLCDRGDPVVNAGCAACFARFGMIEPCRVTMVQNGLIAALTVLAGEDNPETLQLCVSTYSQLSCDPSICRELIEKGIVHSLASLAAAPEEAVRRACAIAFCNLSASEDNIVTLVQHGALKALLVISCVKSNDAITRRMCMKAVMNLMRSPANIPAMCNDGLPWAFTIFAMSSEEQDFPILADAFCGLSYYHETRKGLAKSSTLTAFLQILHRIYDTPAGATMLRGILNILTDVSVIPSLLNAGLLVELNHLAEADSVDIRRMVAQTLTGTFQSSSDARSKYLEEATLHTIGHLLKTDDSVTKHSCAVLLHVLSLDNMTVRVLILNDTMTTVLDTIRASPSVDVMILLMRAIYNISCRADLLVHVCRTGIVSAIAFMVSSECENPQSIAMCAAIMRNLSCEDSCHAQLVNSDATALLVAIFSSKDVLKLAKEDAAIGVCNLLLGRVNSSVMLAQGALTPILWLSAHAPSVESNVLCSAVLRKLAMPPGNIQQLVDEGAVPSVASLLATTTNLFIKRNCTATFCLLARKLSVKPTLASHGVISLTLDLLEELKRSPAPSPLVASIEKMSIELVSTLAEFVRPNVPGEKHLSSVLFQLIDVDDSGGAASTGGGYEWEQDRTFLVRAEDGPLPLAIPSAARQLRLEEVPTLRVPLTPVTTQGYTETFSVSRDERGMKMLDPAVPHLNNAYGGRNSAAKMDDNLDVLRKVMIAHTTNGVGGGGIRSAGWKKLISMEFSSQEMFPKLRTAFPPLAANGATAISADQPLVKTLQNPIKDKRKPSTLLDPKIAMEAGIKSSVSFTIQHAVLASPIRVGATPRSAGGRRITLAPVGDDGE
ncbi:unnamed protein product [Aphanomyces euteiches]|uniref:Armadillo repeat-containing domain-containing protein n=1 Tax=Aphanomyces euteiches TaxID=100861 RepID=A0A6G0X1Y3_9STRA|nr:hypothetical protein Ae201684_009395 [Aphanomyces euteiches]KAH9070377.1 hypothetical protein Ae201684P_002736 [Aphanomyces euteiches]KAH9156873.1 hypothetical protein AeRB84_001269 [Aphanomyces euteiches]